MIAAFGPYCLGRLLPRGRGGLSKSCKQDCKDYAYGHKLLYCNKRSSQGQGGRTSDPSLLAKSADPCPGDGGSIGAN